MMSILFGLSPHETTEATAAGRHQQRPGWAAKPTSLIGDEEIAPFDVHGKNAFATKDH